MSKLMILKTQSSASSGILYSYSFLSIFFFTLILYTSYVPESFCPEYGHRSLKLEIAEICVIM